MQKIFNLDGKTPVETGASSGLGKHFPKTLSAAGPKLDISARRMQNLEELKDEIDGEVLVLPLDVTSEDSVKELFSEINNSVGAPDILINNAGITKDYLFLSMKEDDWDEVLNINLKANYSLCKMVIKNMVKKRWGRIINISSAVAKMGNAGQTNYAASKAAIEGFTRSLSLEVASRGITVNAVAPGFIKTEILDSIDPEKLETMAKNIPVGRIGDVKDISSIVSFLASDESSYITGQVLHVNGGLTL